MVDLGVTKVFTSIVTVAPVIEDDSFAVLFATGELRSLSAKGGEQGCQFQESPAQSDDSFQALQGASPR